MRRIILIKEMDVSEDKKEWVQCFYNIEFKYYGQEKFACGFHKFKLLGDGVNLVDQIKSVLCFDFEGVSDINIKALTPFHDNVFEAK